MQRRGFFSFLAAVPAVVVAPRARAEATRTSAKTRVRITTMDVAVPRGTHTEILYETPIDKLIPVLGSDVHYTHAGWGVMFPIAHRERPEGLPETLHVARHARYIRPQMLFVASELPPGINLSEYNQPTLIRDSTAERFDDLVRLAAEGGRPGDPIHTVHVVIQEPRVRLHGLVATTQTLDLSRFEISVPALEI